MAILDHSQGNLAMKTVEALLTLLVLAFFLAGANIIAESDAAAKIGTTAMHGTNTVYPLLALGLLAGLLVSGAYFVAREMRQEDIERRQRNRF